MRQSTPTLSLVVPVYNEATGLRAFHTSLVSALKKLALTYEIIYVNDGSTDGSRAVLGVIADKDANVHVHTLSRNFGKEIATTAGVHQARGKATMMIDADGQHPVEKIGEFVGAWRDGAKVVVGLREQNSGEGPLKHYGSKLFHVFFNHFSPIKMQQGSTDFRLIDREVREVFSSLTERNRITRGLIDWLGFERAYVPFVAKSRTKGKSGYSFGKLCKLAVDSVISLSNLPLYLAAYIGGVITLLSGIIGVGMVVNFFLHDPLSLNAHASAYALILVLFLVGMVLVFQGIIGLYLSHIHTETQNRPLYIIEKDDQGR